MSTPDKAAPQLQKETALDALQMRQRRLEEELEQVKAAIARLRSTQEEFETSPDLIPYKEFFEKYYENLNAEMEGKVAPWKIPDPETLGAPWRLTDLNPENFALKKSTNEWVLVANERLRSTQEEFETSSDLIPYKEFFEKYNENLNAEMEGKVAPWKIPDPETLGAPWRLTDSNPENFALKKSTNEWVLVANERKADGPRFSQAVRTASTPVSYSSRRPDRKSTTSVIPSEYPSSITVQGFPGKILVTVPIGPETITLEGFKEYIHQTLELPENKIIKPVHQGVEIHTDEMLQSLLKGSQKENEGWIQYFIRSSPTAVSELLGRIEELSIAENTERTPARKKREFKQMREKLEQELNSLLSEGKYKRMGVYSSKGVY